LSETDVSTEHDGRGELDGRGDEGGASRRPDEGNEDEPLLVCMEDAS